MIETRQIDLNKGIIQEVHLLDPEEKHKSPTIIEIRETGQYGINLSLKDETFNRLLKITKTILDQTKIILEG